MVFIDCRVVGILLPDCRVVAVVLLDCRVVAGSVTRLKGGVT